MARRNLAWVLGILGVAVLAFAVGHSAPTRDRDRDYELVRLVVDVLQEVRTCLLYTSPSPRDVEESRMPSSA